MYQAGCQNTCWSLHMANATKKEMSSTNKHLIISNCFTTCIGIKHEKKNNGVLDSILEELIILTKYTDKNN